MLVEKLPDPPYAAVMICVPTAKLDLVIMAWCVEALSAAVPMTVAPSLKLTVPVGLPGNAGVTVAVKVTAVP